VNSGTFEPAVWVDGLPGRIGTITVNALRCYYADQPGGPAVVVARGQTDATTGQPCGSVEHMALIHVLREPRMASEPADGFDRGPALGYRLLLQART
jgi:hypothetical protein